MTHEVRSVTVDIEAPQPFVWDVLLDYPRYPEWNPYTVRVESTCRLGEPVDLYLPDPRQPGELLHQREWVCLVDPPRQFAYQMLPTPELDVQARRDQYVEATSETSCRYWTTDVLTGPLADLVMTHSGAWMRAGFDAVAAALKVRAETLWQQEEACASS